MSSSSPGSLVSTRRAHCCQAKGGRGGTWSVQRTVDTRDFQFGSGHRQGTSIHLARDFMIGTHPPGCKYGTLSKFTAPSHFPEGQFRTTRRFTCAALGGGAGRGLKSRAGWRPRSCVRQEPGGAALLCSLFEDTTGCPCVTAFAAALMGRVSPPALQHCRFLRLQTRIKLVR